MGRADPNGELPTVVFLDIDRTIIGRANASVERFFLRKVIAQLGEAGEIPTSRLPQPPYISPALEMDPVLRPGFADAIQRIRKVFANVELFVCTMGVPVTVTDHKVPGIEAVSGVRFNRPLFHRDFCQSAASKERKLVAQCFRHAIEALSHKKKYREALSDPARCRRVFDERFFMVDDTLDVAFDDRSNARLIKCPPFQYMPESDPFVGIGAAVLKSPKVARYIREAHGPKSPKSHSNRNHSKHSTKNHESDGFWPELADAAEECRSVPALIRHFRRKS